MEKVYWFIVAALAVWRITHLLQAEDGPWQMIVRFRRALGSGMWGSLLDCFYCLSVWIAVPFAVIVGASWRERLLLWPALSGAAILMERMGETPAVPPATYVEGDDNGLLRE